MFKKKSEEKKRSENNNLNDTLVILIKIAGIFIFCIFGIYFLNFGPLGISNNSEVWAQFGDFIGGVLNPLLAFLAFVALLFTIRLQSDALKISKEELQATREELEKSRIAQEKQSESLILQNKATNLQMFENSFFNVTKLYDNSKLNLFFSLKNCNTFINGNQKFRIDNENYNSKINIFDNDVLQVKSVDVIDKFLLILEECFQYNYNEFNKYFEKYTGSYFGIIYQILKLIDGSNIEDKTRYSNLFRSLLTKNELELLFFHCLGNIGKNKFKSLIENNEFFEHIIINENLEDYLLSYNIKAFGKNAKILNIYNKRKIKDIC